MYKKRQRHYSDLALDPEDGAVELTDEEDAGQEEEHTDDNGSVASTGTHERSQVAGERDQVMDERSATPDESNAVHAPTSTPANRPEEPAYRPRSKNDRMGTGKPTEIGYKSARIDSRRQEDGIKRAKYDPDTRKLIPKNTEWQLMQNPVRMQMRQILSDDYRKTLSNIAGSTTFGDLSKQTLQKGKKLLLPIASEIDKELRLTLIPGKIESKLLDSETPASYRKLNQQVEESLRKMADFIAKVNEREAGLIPLRKELAELEERYKIAQQRHDSRMDSNGNQKDYVQMLLVHPSSDQY